MDILTDYIIQRKQCPLWEEHTDNVRDLKYLDPELLKAGLAPKGVRAVFSFVFDSPLLVAWKLYRRRRAYKLVITGDHRVGFFYALLCRLSPSLRIPHLQIDFLLDDPRHSPCWSLKRRLLRYVLSRMDCILVYSHKEAQTYASLLRMRPEKFRVIPYHTNILNPRLVRAEKGYLFSAGRSGRDYRTLFEALRGIDARLVLVCDRRNLEGLQVPANVELHCEVPYEKYLELLEGARIVIIPLKPEIRSLGQVVMLEAMALGKPVIATYSVSVIEYMRDGENGFLLDGGDAEALREKIVCLLQQPELCDRVGRKALEDVLSFWTFEKYVRNVFKVAQELIAGSAYAA